ncbi:hypothetical protein NDU88_005383 [Pleurodeles waltl]|uniref:Uncharacterized protein n=1 Tax=Pleurodeles waltl TaxID=8319 RepID=A0AAV7M9U5_PLEWA|nr:hypothetical protein NDU88_005383 [Pleurodeles waltl]
MEVARTAGPAIGSRFSARKEAGLSMGCLHPVRSQAHSKYASSPSITLHPVLALELPNVFCFLGPQRTASPCSDQWTDRDVRFPLEPSVPAPEVAPLYTVPQIAPSTFIRLLWIIVASRKNYPNATAIPQNATAIPPNAIAIPPNAITMP